MSTKAPMRPLQARIPDNLRNWLRSQARAQDRSMNWVLLKVLEEAQKREVQHG